MLQPDNRKGAWSLVCRNGHLKGPGGCPVCKSEWTARKLQEKRAARAADPRCRNGHPKKAPGLCPVCKDQHDIRRAQRERKSKEVVLEATVIARTAVPWKKAIVQMGFWKDIAEQVKQLTKMEALKVDMKGAQFIYAGLFRHLKGSGVRFSYQTQGGFVYLWRL